MQPEEKSDPSKPREIENPGDPGPPILVPPGGKMDDQRESEKLPPNPLPPPGV